MTLTLSGTPPPVLPTSHLIWTNPTIGPWDKWGDASPQSPRGYATVNTNDVTYDYVKMADERDDAFMSYGGGSRAYLILAARRTAIRMKK